VPDLSNVEIAEQFLELAQLLEQQDANPYRAGAYRAAARTLQQTRKPVVEILSEEGVEGLRRLPGIGERLAGAIRELLETGKLSTLERLQGEMNPVEVLMTVPGIGQELAERLHKEHDIDSLEGLELAVHEGRLEDVPGFGRKRVEGIKDTLAVRLGRRWRKRESGEAEEPSVAELLDVDREYREKAAAGKLPKLAPKRFNPNGEKWLPILHAERGDRHYTALFSNTARAHELGKTDDWVVLYFDAGKGERQVTVVTATSGLLEGKRVVRGREAGCRRYYQAQS
jgi:DNA polymerase (family X)